MIEVYMYIIRVTPPLHTRFLLPCRLSREETVPVSRDNLVLDLVINGSCAFD